MFKYEEKTNEWQVGSIVWWTEGNRFIKCMSKNKLMITETDGEALENGQEMG